ncbi:MAG: S16 family serine protease [Candidatus Micrarchaeia archaeon]
MYFEANSEAYRKRIFAIAIVAIAVAMLLPANMANAQLVGSAEIHAPAVITSNNTGVLTIIELKVYKGNGTVSVGGPAEVGASTLQSAQTAAQYAASYLGKNFGSYNFNYTILNSDADNVSGPSAGAAMTMLAISALSGKPLASDFTMTGTINSNGAIGLIGGVYDKVSAAKSGGMRFVLVPAAYGDSNEEMLYALVQDEFGIPLVQVKNVSAALNFAIYGENAVGKGTTYTPFVNYHVNEIGNASVECVQSCNSQAFNGLVAFTFNLTRDEIGTLAPFPNFSGISDQLSKGLNQSILEAEKGYGYTGADQSFLDYITAYYFSHHTITKQGGMQVMQNVSSSCAALETPQLTSSNYQYVLGGELRQLWANYTITQDMGEYNATAVDTDGVLDSIYEAGEASGWCAAASYMYNASYAMGGAYVSASPALKGVAESRLQKASAYGPSLYFTTAEQAYRSGNYPLAILDSDYALVFGNATLGSGIGTGKLINMSKALASNATFGVWATQFANEALFYAQEAALSSNSSLALEYAQEAYSTALLAERISNDTSLISANLEVQAQPPITVQNYEGEFSTLLAGIAAIEKELLAIFMMLLALLIALIAIFIALVVLINRSRKMGNALETPSESKEALATRKTTHARAEARKWKSR